MDFDLAAEVFKALGDPHRLKALHFLATATPDCCQGPDGVCACDLITHLELAQPTVSHHMRVLTQAHLVTATKRGRWTHYTLSTSGLQHVQQLLGAWQTQGTSLPSCSTQPPAVPQPRSPAQGALP
ncbi:ArsR/SmtB family transcription factor [Deinococcus ruber]|uniref:HTH arsR-type domain-containing protein n=1 Tax=Deinococcus ruber TaxID=1848197 RepID=A0A918CJ97_9DEIO|nr:metalloregulator ArsR/SmtB family transcription factor [Deinococcus ruber]GGR27068.1 hypothetical protein GCM10008957_43010 [Deinococcus ruber]